MDTRDMRNRLLGKLAASLETPLCDHPFISERRFTVLAIDPDPSATMSLPAMGDMTIH